LRRSGAASIPEAQIGKGGLVLTIAVSVMLFR